jgi:hypothetical protein
VRTRFSTSNVPKKKPSGCWVCGDETAFDLCSVTCTIRWQQSQPRARFLAAIEGDPVNVSDWAKKIGREYLEANAALLKFAQERHIAVWATTDENGGVFVQQFGKLAPPKPSSREKKALRLARRVERRRARIEAERMSGAEAA